MFYFLRVFESCVHISVAMSIGNPLDGSGRCLSQCQRSLAGTYKTTDALYCRNDAGSNKKALCVIPAGTEVHNYGYYTTYNGVKWLYITVTLDGVEYIGFSSKSYLKK